MLPFALTAVLALSSSVIHPSAAELDAGWRAYHDGEFAGSAAVVGAGVVFVGSGAGLALVDDAFARGLAGSLAVGGALAAAGFAYYCAIIPGRVDDGVTALRENVARFDSDERERMAMVVERFTPLRLASGALVAAGLVAFGVGKAVDVSSNEDAGDVVAGVGVGVSVVAFTVFVYDSAAAERGRAWQQQLE